MIKQYLQYRKRILHTMKKWNTQTALGQQWPVEGTFDETCEEVEAIINTTCLKMKER